MRRVSAISDYLESPGKAEAAGGCALQKRERQGEPGAGEKRKESELWIAGGTGNNSSKCARAFLPSQHMAD